MQKLGRPTGTVSSPDRKALHREVFDLPPFSEWCRTLTQSVDQFADEPLILEAWQDAFINEALEIDGDEYKWQSVALVLPRKNGKTTMLAAYSLYRLFEKGQPEILLAAASYNQAKRLYGSIVAFIRQSPHLSDLLIVREYDGEISRKDGGGKIQCMPSQPHTLHGYNPSLVICDELHGWLKPQQRKAWAALTTAGGARSKAQTFSISTAGAAEERKESILGQLIDRNEEFGDIERQDGLTISRNYDARTLVYNYSAPTNDPNDIAAMKLANPASWITPDYLKRQASNPELARSEVLQLHGSVWSAGSKAWLPEGTWDHLKEPREVEDGTRVILGFDGSYNNDSTALIGCTMDDKPHIFVVGLWERPANVKEWNVPRNEVEQAVRAAFQKYDVVELACDPPAWYAEIERWTEEFGSPPVVEVETRQVKRMSEYCSRFYTAVVTQALTHDGNQRLAAHIANASTKKVSGSDGVYITKESKHSMKKIDAAIAAVLAFGRATQQPTGGFSLRFADL